MVYKDTILKFVANVLEAEFIEQEEYYEIRKFIKGKTLRLMFDEHATLIAVKHGD